LKESQKTAAYLCAVHGAMPSLDSVYRED